MRFHPMLLLVFLLLIVPISHAEDLKTRYGGPPDEQELSQQKRSPRLVITADGEWYIIWGPRSESGKPARSSEAEDPSVPDTNESGGVILRINENGYTLEWDMQRQTEGPDVVRDDRDTPEHLIIHR
jgi:hypothetical protein